MNFGSLSQFRCIYDNDFAFIFPLFTSPLLTECERRLTHKIVIQIWNIWVNNIKIIIIVIGRSKQYFLSNGSVWNAKVKKENKMKAFGNSSFLCIILQYYMTFEISLCLMLSYLAIYYGKIFDYQYTDTSQFVRNIDTNLYYSLMFGLNLTNVDVKEQRIIQGN
jgi:hypothetical protein